MRSAVRASASLRRWTWFRWSSFSRLLVLVRLRFLSFAEVAVERSGWRNDARDLHLCMFNSPLLSFPSLSSFPFVFKCVSGSTGDRLCRFVSG